MARPNVQFEDAIEQIDIGGVTLLRAAAKNCAHVVVACDPSDYAAVLAEVDGGELSFRKGMALKAFRHTATYDQAISGYLEETLSGGDVLPPVMLQTNTLVSTLRYGENPHQSAGVYLPAGEDRF